MARPIGTTRLRRRLTLAFLLVGAVSAGALASAPTCSCATPASTTPPTGAAADGRHLQLAAVTAPEEQLLDGLSRRPGFCAVVVPDSGESSRTCLTPGWRRCPRR